MNKNIITSLLLATLLASCSHKKLDYVVTDYSHDKKPVWVNDIKKFEKKKDNEAIKFKYFRSEGESINKRLCEKSAIVNTNVVIAGEISNELDNLYTGLTEVQMEEMMLNDNKKEETKNRIKNRLVGVELRETYWEKRKYSTELGADKDKTVFYCYQLSRVDRKKHDTIINEMFERELRNIKNNQVKEEIKDQVKKNAEEMNVEIKD